MSVCAAPRAWRCHSVIERRLTGKYNTVHPRADHAPVRLRRCEDKFRADLAITLLLRLAGRSQGRLMGDKLAGQTLGIVGFDRAAQVVARRACDDFGMKILVQHRTAVDRAMLHRCHATQLATIEDLLPRCDFVSLHCAQSGADHRVMNSTRLDLMKEDAGLINTSRGAMIDETALAHCLMFDTIGGAALSVRAADGRIDPLLAQCDNLFVSSEMGRVIKPRKQTPTTLQARLAS